MARKLQALRSKRSSLQARSADLFSARVRVWADLDRSFYGSLVAYQPANRCGFYGAATRSDGAQIDLPAMLDYIVLDYIVKETSEHIFAVRVKYHGPRRCAPIRRPSAAHREPSSPPSGDSSTSQLLAARTSPARRPDRAAFRLSRRRLCRRTTRDSALRFPSPQNGSSADSRQPVCDGRIAW